MSKVNNKDPLERLLHQIFHDIADKYDIDVDTVADIITDWDDTMLLKHRELEITAPAFSDN